MSEINDIKKAFQILIHEAADKTKADILKVASVDRESKTCDLLDENTGSLYLDARLCAVINTGENQSVLYPKVGSYVAAVPKDKNTDKLLVIMVHETDGIELNGNKYSSVKGEQLQTELNTIKATLQLVLNAINNGVPTPSAADGGAGLQISMKAIIASAQDADFSKILNEKVKHG